MRSNFEPFNIADNKFAAGNVVNQAQDLMDHELSDMTPLEMMAPDAMKELMDSFDNMSQRGFSRRNSFTALGTTDETDGTDYHGNPGIAGDNGLFNIFGTLSGSPGRSLESSPPKLSKGFSFEDSSGFDLIDGRGGSLSTSPAKKTSTSRTPGSCPKTLPFNDEGNTDAVLADVAKALTSGENQSGGSDAVVKVTVRRVDVNSPIVNGAVVGKKRKHLDEIDSDQDSTETVDENPTAKRIGEAFATCKKACILGHKWSGTKIWKCPHARCEYICKHRKNLFQHFYGKKGHKCIVPGNEHFGVVDGVRVVPRGFSKYKYVCPVVGCGLKYEEKRQLYNHFHDQDGVCDHNIDFSCLCPRSGKRSNSELNIKKATTTYRLTGKVVEVLDREGKACKRETNEKGQFIDSKGRVLQKSGLPEPGQEHSESDSSDDFGPSLGINPTIGINPAIGMECSI